MNFIRKHELAFKYFPDAPTKKAATDNLTRAINRCKPLLEALTRSPGGYSTLDKQYSPHQVALIYQYLGEPD
ncbi:MAG: DUF4248 domain-containing protein [Bacteroidales bacterium]|nr:DUF4248 domain-containing protein [Bacteroidales bacterium]